MFKATVTIVPADDGRGCGECPFLRVQWVGSFCILFRTRSGERWSVGRNETRRCKPCRDAEKAAKTEGGKL